MKEKDFVSYDIAKILNEKGYDEDCLMNRLTKDIESFGVKEGELSLARYSTDDVSNCIKAPLLSEAQKWLREKHKLHIEVSINPQFSNTWFYVLWSIEYHSSISISGGFDSYEEALNEGIKEALKNL